MRVLEEMLERAVRLQTELETGYAIRRIIETPLVEGIIIDMNAREQLYDLGVNNLGIKISDYAPYTPITQWIKEEKGQPYDRVTLRDTGDFHESFFLSANNEEFRLDASDEKRDKLVRKYGATIFGLTKEKISELIEGTLRPHLEDYIRKVLYE